MFNSTVLEIAAGLIFTYLITSLICSAVNELIASACRSRATTLEIGIRNLLDGNSERFTKASIASPTFAMNFFNHPLIDSLSKQNELPSYIPADIFSTVFMNLVAVESKIPSALKTISGLQGTLAFEKLREMAQSLPQARIQNLLLAIVDRAEAESMIIGNELQEVTKRVEQWYDQAMNRVSGWYKRRTQLALLIISLVVTVLCNIDTIAIWQSLGSESTRASILNAAEQTLHDSAPLAHVPTLPSSRPVDSPTPELSPPKEITNLPSPALEVSKTYETIHSQLGQLEQSGVPIGWFWNTTGTADRIPRGDNLYDVITNPRELILKLLGFLLTAAAASLGAPFWFDMLSKIMAVRSTGSLPNQKDPPTSTPDTTNFPAIPSREPTNAGIRPPKPLKSSPRPASWIGGRLPQ